jgi:Interferon-related developmental regulator (IFRD)
MLLSILLANILFVWFICLIYALRTSEGEPAPDELVAAALQGWALLATAAAPQWLATTAVSAYLPILIDLLESNSMDVRTGAGETAALLREAVDEVARLQVTSFNVFSLMFALWYHFHIVSAMRCMSSVQLALQLVYAVALLCSSVVRLFLH